MSRHRQLLRVQMINPLLSVTFYILKNFVGLKSVRQTPFRPPFLLSLIVTHSFFFLRNRIPTWRRN
ncbi:hypothetical protein F4806DRAFT_478986 [Annulohypoxylon nitens]|nr:hypothetical protein F4806DRAFT_478986 [Annulohypoxylon nitens]